MILKPGQEFAHFKIIRKIGEGGMGEVYLAEDTKLNRNVALKILLSEFFDSADRLARFKREAQTAAKISNANVMAIHDMGKAVEKESGRELNYIVMENIEGETLTEYMQTHNPDINELLRLSEKIAAGLAAAHKLGIVHRDIKSDNIKITPEGDPKILDFGLAKPTEMSALGDNEDTEDDTISRELTQEGKILGTVTYMSPEQVRGEQVDTRSDIFSFGVLIYRLFAGEFPFEATEKVSVMAKILEVKQNPIRQKNEALPAELERIIDKCLQKDPNDRYQDTRDLVVDIRNLRRQYASNISDTVSTISEAPKFKRSHTLILSGKSIATILVLCAAVVVILLWILKKPEVSEMPALQAKEHALAIFGFVNKTGDNDLNWLQAGMPEMLLTDLAQSGSINIISRNSIIDRLERPPENDSTPISYQDYVKAAKSLGAVMALSGSYYKLGDKIRIDARLEDINTGRIIMGEKVVGSQLYDLIDSLTQKIAVALNVKEMMLGNKEIADLTSSSPEAYKQYILGMEKYGMENYEEAIAQFQKAIEIDSSFALPYLRIGMANYFRGRQQNSAPYFAAAEKLKDKLPRKDRDMLDIYVDAFLRSKFDDAYAKMIAYIGNYPEDKEIRSLYAVFLYQISNNPAQALAELDTVLMLDPKYKPALENYIVILADQSEYEKGIEYAKKMKEYYPDGANAYELLSTFYTMLGRYDEAISECKELRKIAPDNSSALTSLIRISILKRDFDSAQRYTEEYKKDFSGDPYNMFAYYNTLANLAVWHGQFKQALDYDFDYLKQARGIGDSIYIHNGCIRVADLYFNIGNVDSTVYYGKEGAKYATQFRAFDYPALLMRLGPKYRDEAKKLFPEALEYFKANIPNELWNIADAIDEIFQSYMQDDTAAIIAALEKMKTLAFQDNVDNAFTLGKLLILTGDYQRGIDALNSLFSGENITSSGMRTMLSKYYIGMAYEGLGQRDKAIESYKEVLEYWGNADIQIKEIKDTRNRLKKLTS
jgi:eukaryotic-like serine/threonine-protein kinase